jgi:single-strand DNA-binding protein
MSDGINKVWLLGNLGADPELRMTPGGRAVLKLRLATTESYVDKSEQRKEITEWHHVSVWGARGERLAPMLHKGQRLLVEGRIHYSSTEKDGQKRYYTDIDATEIHFAGASRASARPGVAGFEALVAAGAPLPMGSDVASDLDVPF